MDELDLAEEREYIARQDALRAIQNAAEKFDPGISGECDTCGEYFGRIVNGLCARCRDKYKK